MKKKSKRKMPAALQANAERMKKGLPLVKRDGSTAAAAAPFGGKGKKRAPAPAGSPISVVGAQGTRVERGPGGRLVKRPVGSG